MAKNETTFIQELLTIAQSIHPQTFVVLIIVFWLIFLAFYIRFVFTICRTNQPVSDTDIGRAQKELSKRIYIVILAMIVSFTMVFFPFHPLLDKLLPDGSQQLLWSRVVVTSIGAVILLLIFVRVFPRYQIRTTKSPISVKKDT